MHRTVPELLRPQKTAIFLRHTRPRYITVLPVDYEGGFYQLTGPLKLLQRVSDNSCPTQVSQLSARVKIVLPFPTDLFRKCLDGLGSTGYDGLGNKFKPADQAAQLWQDSPRHGRVGAPPRSVKLSLLPSIGNGRANLLCFAPCEI